MFKKETLYCFGCGQLIPREKAFKTFRTGFYRVIYPLAFCVDCAKREEEREQEIYDPRDALYSEITMLEAHEARY
ncbi:MAG: hypothetical protein JWM44_1913 [Bacilli bacterium]|jgi:ribosomal protein S26|nr:hypothetical protein [Bacilli bacterium]